MGSDLNCREAVVKLGGSAITVKSSPETVNWESLSRVVSALASFVRSGGRLIVVHGGGSFGHYAVDRLQRERGSLGPLEVAEVQRAMLVLAMAVISELTGAGVPATLHPAHTMCRSQTSCDLRPMVSDYEVGLVPVTYGDAVLCCGRGEIVSGDYLASQLATLVNAECLIYVTDVKGVLGPDGSLLRQVRPGEPIGALRSSGPDVTGGISRKISEAASSAAKVVRIVHWEDLDRALRGEEVGTLVVR
ncbi:MAG: isopentenyl phosphate kinase family protein [Acidilobus sp.]|nr:isopentenyl phosphate kinase family protein [Acidilobus sp.]